MKTIYYSSGKNRELEELKVSRKGAWVSLVAPDDAELKNFAKKYKLDQDLLRDAVDLYEAPRVETDEGKVYIYTRYCYPEGREVATEPMLIVYTPDNLLTVSRLNASIYKRLVGRGVNDVLTTQKTKMLMMILGEINNSYRLQLNTTYRQVLRIRSQLRQGVINNQEFIHIIELEEDLNEFLAALQPQEAMLNMLTNGKFISLYEEDHDIIEDLVLSTKELIELTKSRLLTLTNIRQAYDAIATNNLNAIFKRLTSIAIFLTVPTIIGGLWGMNIRVPFADQPFAFLYVILIIVTLVSLAIAFFNKKHWL